MTFIPVCEPLLKGNELAYVIDAVNTGWISSSGKYVREFEEKFSSYCGVRYGVAVCNGTVALHLALVALGIGKGDEVIIPNFTMVASAFAVCYTGALPVFIDAEFDNWNIDPNLIEKSVTARTKAIMPVSIFGHPCEMDSIRAIAKKHGLYLIEDAAESHGAEYKGKRVGSLADVTTFSFFANKNITTGEGGMVVTDDEELFNKARYFRNMCFALDGPRNYTHEHIGFNYRISNLHAAIGCAQVEKAEEYVALRERNGNLYRKYLADIPGIRPQTSRPYVRHAQWMNGIVLDPLVYGRSRNELVDHLGDEGIETRSFFIGMNRQPALLAYGCSGIERYPVTDSLSQNGLYLPSGTNLSETTISFICQVIRDFSK
jgi:perosamine synthetase